MHSCESCGKEFNFPYLLLRHLNRVTSCSPNKVSVENENNVKEKEKNVNESDKKVNTSKKNVISDDKNVNTIGKKVNNDQEKEFQCDKCEKVLKSKLGLYRHNNICKGVHSLECPTCFKTFSNRVSKCRHIKKAKCSPPEKKVDQCKDLEEENRLLRKENAILKATRGNTINNNNNITNYTIKYQVKYNPETKCLTTEDPKAPFPELLCFNGFKHEAARSKLKNIDQEQLQEHIDNVRRNKDYYNLYSFFFRNVDNRRLQMFNMGKNNNATHAQVFNNGSLEKMEKSTLFDNASKYIGQYLLNMSIENADVIYHLTTDQASKNAFIEMTKDKSHTFNYYRENDEDYVTSDSQNISSPGMYS